MRWYLAISLGAMFAVVAGAPALSATVRTVPGRAGHVAIRLSGKIVTGDADAFLKALAQADMANKMVESVQLNSSGGKLGEGAKLAAVIKSRNLATVVESGAVCASACFLAFAAGAPKFAGPAALIGVHKASASGGIETRQSGAATILMARLAKEFGVPTSILNRMLTTPPAQVAWLDAQDFRAMGVKTLSANVQPSTIPHESVTVVERAGAGAPTVTNVKPAQKMDRPSWDEFMAKTIALSAEQNNGNAIIRRLCKPELKQCVAAVAFQLPDGRKALATSVEDDSGNITRREVCESNASDSARDCMNWDTGASYRDVKDAEGSWVENVADR